MWPNINIFFSANLKLDPIADVMVSDIYKNCVSLKCNNII